MQFEEPFADRLFRNVIISISLADVVVTGNGDRTGSKSLTGMFLICADFRHATFAPRLPFISGGFR